MFLITYPIKHIKNYHNLFYFKRAKREFEITLLLKSSITKFTTEGTFFRTPSVHVHVQVHDAHNHLGVHVHVHSVYIHFLVHVHWH